MPEWRVAEDRAHEQALQGPLPSTACRVRSPRPTISFRTSDLSLLGVDDFRLAAVGGTRSIAPGFSRVNDASHDRVRVACDRPSCTAYSGFGDTSAKLAGLMQFAGSL